jgi:hypothetical protein
VVKWLRRLAFVLALAGVVLVDYLVPRRPVRRTLAWLGRRIKR